jgi:hypothetical protein
MAEDLTVPYSGRFVQDDGKPVEGPVDIVVGFYAAESGGSSLSTPVSVSGVELTDGVFQVGLTLSAADWAKVLGDGKSPAWVQITDSTNSKDYPRQQFGAIPYAMRVPVDGTTLKWNSSGLLEVQGLGSATSLNGQAVFAAAPTAGQVLVWDAVKKYWKPGPAASGDIVNNGQTGTVTIGSNSGGGLNLETNNVTRLAIDSAGAIAASSNITITGNLTADAIVLTQATVTDGGDCSAVATGTIVRDSNGDVFICK